MFKKIKENAITAIVTALIAVPCTIISTHGVNFGERVAVSAINFVKKPLKNEENTRINKELIVKVNYRCDRLDSLILAGDSIRAVSDLKFANEISLMRRDVNSGNEKIDGMIEALEMVSLGMAKGNDSTASIYEDQGITGID